MKPELLPLAPAPQKSRSMTVTSMPHPASTCAHVNPARPTRPFVTIFNEPGTIDAGHHKMRALLTFAALAAVSCSSETNATRTAAPPETQPAPAPAPSVRRGPQPVEVEMSNVNFRVTSDITLHVKHLRGRFVPTGGSDITYLDDKHSFVVAIDSGEIGMDMASLNALMKSTLEEGDANIEKIRISADDGNGLRQKGLLDKGIKVPFDLKGRVEATPDGRIRVRAASMRTLGIPVKPLMRVFGIEMDDLVKVKPGHGVVVEDNDLILDPEQLVPPPKIRGKVTAVRVADGTLVQTFGSGERRRLSPAAVSQNHIYLRGGQLRFGKLTMSDTDLELIDDDPSDPFDFSVDHWNDQLVAGYSKNTPARGLKTHVPDYSDLRSKK